MNQSNITISADATTMLRAWEQQATRANAFEAKLDKIEEIIAKDGPTPSQRVKMIRDVIRSIE